MADINGEYLGKHKKFRTDNKKLAMIFVLVAIIIAVVVFWWLKLVGVTITGEAFCGLDEHTHSQDCYTSELICGLGEETAKADTASESTLPSEIIADEEISSEEETSQENHVHTDECNEKVLICAITEHIHSADCYPDYTADVESASDWEAAFEDIAYTDTVSVNLLEIAKTQIGYAESQLNFEYDENGTKRGYTRYGEWYGNPYGNWNAMFVSFCLNYSNIQNMDPLTSSSAASMRQQWESEGFYKSAEKHETKAGELIFLDEDKNGETDYVAVISEVTDEDIKVIIGDINNSVEEIIVEDRETIIGYGLTDRLSVVEEETTTAAETTTQAATTEEETTKVTDTVKESTSVIDIYEDPEWDEKVALFESSLDENVLSGLDELSEEDRKAVIELAYTIDYLPTVDEFFYTLDRYYDSGDEYGETQYIIGTQEKMISAYAHYQGIEHLENHIFNLSKLFELKDYYSNSYVSQLTTGTSSAVTFNFINRGWSAVAPVVIYGGSAGEIITTGSSINQYWYGIVVEYDSSGNYYYVSEKYTGGSSSSATKVNSLEATTSKGFVIFIWMADAGATTAQQTAAAVASNVVVGDRVTVSVDPTTLSSGYSSSGYGTITFSEEPEEIVSDPIVEDIPLEEIQNGELSDDQVIQAGGISTSPEGDVQISKSIDGTDIENVFDITLTVRTETSVQTYLEEPDMAVVIVMDISNTMNSKYPSNQTVTTRYDAAVEAAENFINQFAKETAGISQLGFVAFNTNATKIFDLSPCGDETQASKLISDMKVKTGDIINNYTADDITRFTNVEAGLKMGYDMLANSGNENKYIVFLSDGFPTTYYNPNDTNNSDDFYAGYNPYTPSGTKGADGVFYDYVTGYYCSYGTSYSDKAAIKAREMANKIKGLDAKIFSIGVDIGGQTIEGYERTGLSVIDRTGTTYEIGDAKSDEAYKEWLRNSIGSEYYFDSIAKDDITNAFNDIFVAIKNLNKENRYTIWTTTDPLPVFDENSAIVEFIHFYDKDDNPAAELDGDIGEGLENTAYHNEGTIYWDLKDSGYIKTEETVGDITTTYYYYSVTYRVRLYNEADKFVEYTPYETNGEAYLEYKTIINTNGVNAISEKKILHYPKPVVEGYYADFYFLKQSDLGDPLSGAEFTLTHDDVICNECQGNGQPVTSVSELGPFTSEADGKVNFSKIPSGHVYTFKETVFPQGYVDSGKSYKVTIAMDKISVMIYESADDTEGTLWSGDNGLVIINPPEVYLLPETGGSGTLHLTIIGFALMAFPILCSILRRKRERRFN